MSRSDVVVAVYVNSVLASLNFRSTAKGPAIPMGRQAASVSVPFGFQSDHSQSTYPVSSTMADTQPQIQLDSFISAAERDYDGISSQGSKKHNP
ncbi:hypothetical protein V5O48_006883 [Marasmius crinis-equi]|uniref:Uncharacterized protein n=1 Tax=Marasmius crinis-equi TaxID=585013 RepID=A0ABR3FIH3_9AGAR